MVFARLFAHFFGAKKRAEWADISDELKRKVIGELDLRSRLVLRACSKPLLRLVDSTPLTLPRVNVFAARPTPDAEPSIFVTFFTRINRYIQLEFQSGCGEKCTIIQRTMKLKSTHEKSIIVEGVAPLELAARVLRLVCCHPETRLGGLEIDLSLLADDEIHALNTSIGALSATTIRAELVNFSSESQDLIVLARLDEHELKAVEMNLNGELHCFVADAANGDAYGTEVTLVREVLRQGCHHLRRYYDIDKTRALKALAASGEPFIVESLETDDPKWRVSRYATECGMVGEQSFFMIWGDKQLDMQETRTENLALPSEDRPCILSWSCPTHSSPFSRWYYTRARFRCLPSSSRYRADSFETLLPLKNHDAMLVEFVRAWRHTYSVFNFEPSRLCDCFWDALAFVSVCYFLGLIYTYFFTDARIYIRFIDWYL